MVMKDARQCWPDAEKVKAHGIESVGVVVVCVTGDSQSWVRCKVEEGVVPNERV